MGFNYTLTRCSFVPLTATLERSLHALGSLKKRQPQTYVLAKPANKGSN
jgi:hypothetical protein